MNPSRRLGILGGMFDPIHHGHLDIGAAAQRALDLTDLLVVPSRTPPHRPQPIATSFHRFAMVSMAIAGRPGWRALDLELSQATPSYTSDTLRHLNAAGFLPTELFFIAGADAFLEIATWKDYPELLGRAHFAVVSRPGVNVNELPARLPALASRMRNVDISTVRLKPDTTYHQSSATDVGPDVTRHQSIQTQSRLDATVRLPPPRSAPRRVSPKRSEGAKPDLTFEPETTSGQTDTTDDPETTGGLSDTRGDEADDRTFIFLIDATTADVSSTAIREARLDDRTIAGMLPPSVRQHIEQHALYQDQAPTAGAGPTRLSAQAGRLHGQD